MTPWQTRMPSAFGAHGTGVSPPLKTYVTSASAAGAKARVSNAPMSTPILRIGRDASAATASLRRSAAVPGDATRLAGAVTWVTHPSWKEPSPVRSSRSTQAESGATPWRPSGGPTDSRGESGAASAGSALLSASPTANPAGTREERGACHTMRTTQRIGAAVAGFALVAAPVAFAAPVLDDSADAQPGLDQADRNDVALSDIRAEDARADAARRERLDGPFHPVVIDSVDYGESGAQFGADRGGQPTRARTSSPPPARRSSRSPTARSSRSAPTAAAATTSRSMTRRRSGPTTTSTWSSRLR